MIPEAKQPAVSGALHAAFGVDEYENIRLLTGGLSSAMAFKDSREGKSVPAENPAHGGDHDPGNEFACQQAAAEAGIAPGSGLQAWKTGC